MCIHLISNVSGIDAAFLTHLGFFTSQPIFLDDKLSELYLFLTIISTKVIKMHTIDYTN